MKTINTQLDFFFADIIDFAMKGDVGSMDSPFFNLSHKKDLKIKEITRPHAKHSIEPGSEGMPTIFDKDLLLYVISQVIEGEKRGMYLSDDCPTIGINFYNYMKSTHRDTSGKDYDRAYLAVKRLRDVRITSQLKEKSGEWKRRAEFWGIFSYANVVEKDTVDRPVTINVKLDPVIWGAVREKKILTYNPEYFKLKKGYDRRIYEICRKFCGDKKNKWAPTKRVFRELISANSPVREINRNLERIMRDQPIPDFLIADEDDKFGIYYKPGNGCYG